MTWSVDGPPALPLFGDRRGPAQVAEFFRAVGENLAIDEFVPENFVAAGDLVVATGRERGRVPATGKGYSAHWAHVFTFRDGLVVRFREYSDTAAMTEAFGRAA